METVSTEQTEAIKQALAAGQLTIPDPNTGYHRSMYADCPDDGQSAPIRRIVRGSGNAVTELTMRCPRCGKEFVASPETIHLH